jgi:hypothetical protein
VSDAFDVTERGAATRLSRGIVDGRAVILDDRTHVLIDMAVVF